MTASLASAAQRANAYALHSYGPRVAESGLGLIASYLFSAPYEEVRLKGR